MKGIILIICVLFTISIIAYLLTPRVVNVVIDIINKQNMNKCIHIRTYSFIGLMNSSLINKLFNELNNSVKYVIASSQFLMNYVKYGNEEVVCRLITSEFKVPCSVLSSIVINGSIYDKFVAIPLITAILDSLKYNYSKVISIAVLSNNSLNVATADLSRVDVNELSSFLSKLSCRRPLVIIRVTSNNVKLISKYLSKIYGLIRNEVNLAIVYLNASKSGKLSSYDEILKLVKVPIGINPNYVGNASILLVKNDEVLAVLNLKKEARELLNETQEFVAKVVSIVKSSNLKEVYDIVNKLTNTSLIIRSKK